MAGKILIALVVIAVAVSLSFAASKDSYKCTLCRFEDRNCVKPLRRSGEKTVGSITCSTNDLGCYTLQNGDKVKRGCLRTQSRLQELLEEGALIYLCKENNCNTDKPLDWAPHKRA